MNGQNDPRNHSDHESARIRAHVNAQLHSASETPPRDEATREEAYEAYVAARSTESRASRRALARAERARARAAARARARAAARARVTSEGSENAADQVIRSFRTRPWVKAVSTVMAVLLAVTLFDVTGLRPLMFDVSGDDATAATEAEGVKDAKEDLGDLAADAPADADAVDAAEGDAADGDSDASAGADATDPDAADAGADEPQDPAAAKAALLQQVADEPLSADALAALMPANLTDADAVLPHLTDDAKDAAAVASRINPFIDVWGKPLMGGVLRSL